MKEASVLLIGVLMREVEAEGTAVVSVDIEEM